MDRTREILTHLNYFSRFSMLFEAGYEPPAKKSCPGDDVDQGPLDCSKSENNVTDLRIKQVN